MTLILMMLAGAYYISIYIFGTSVERRDNLEVFLLQVFNAMVCDVCS